MDPDAYINQKGKDSFIKFVQNKIDIKDFIWDSYYKEVDRNNPQTLAIFERKIKSLSREVKDRTLGKYFLDNFIRKINELTPYTNYKKSNFSKFNKASNPLQETKDLYVKRNKFDEREFKEFSILFLIMNKLDIFRKNIELVSKINFSNNLIEEFKEKLIEYLLSEKYFEQKEVKNEHFNEKFKSIINQINENAPAKIIYKNKSDEDIISMFNEIVKEIEKIELRKKIDSLEHKVSSNLDENLYTELLSLRNQLKGG